jgi:DNA-binding MarR family transcriptional regulator
MPFARGQRCIVPVDAFYEWKKIGTGKQPYAIVCADGLPLAMAGLRERWKDRETGDTVQTFTIITTVPNELCGALHDRMPVVLPCEKWATWLGEYEVGPDELRWMILRPYPASLMRAYPVGRASAMSGTTMPCCSTKSIWLLDWPVLRRAGGDRPVSMIEMYLEVISLIQRVHRDYLNVIRDVLDRVGAHDINKVQALVLFNIADQKIAIREIETRGNYLGANKSHIIKQLIGRGYLNYQRSSDDFRNIYIWLTEKGQKLCYILADLHAELFADATSNPDLEHAIWALRQIEQFWIDQELEPELWR